MHHPDIAKTQTLAGFAVAGLAARTNNAAESTGAGLIPGIWAQFMQKNPATALIDKLGDEIYAVYTDYESHHTGDYTFVLGFKVSSIQNLPAGLRGVEIPGGEYAVITSDPGPVMQVVPAIWEKIWSLPHLEHRRSYQADFELYGQRAMHPDHAEVDIYLGLR